jgi:hypothetical protein
MDGFGSVTKLWEADLSVSWMMGGGGRGVWEGAMSEARDTEVATKNLKRKEDARARRYLRAEGETGGSAQGGRV